jgi:orotidine-5'-phosphate decarboxylase
VVGSEDKANRARDYLAVALDVPSLQAAEETIELLDGEPGWLKIGSQLFTAVGPAVIAVAAKRARIFLDLKFHDIPNTVASAVKSGTRLGASLMTLHAVGGVSMLRAAKEAAAEEAARLGVPRPELVAVTVLTSTAEKDLIQVGVAGSLPDQVARLLDLALESGIDGVVSSPLEAAAVRKRAGENFRIVTPGIRPADSAIGDQVRIATPASAIAQGSSLLVMGRPILMAENPVEAARAAIAEIEDALDRR